MILVGSQHPTCHVETLSQTAPPSLGIRQGRPGGHFQRKWGPRGGAMRFYVSGKWGFTLIWGFLSAVILLLGFIFCYIFVSVGNMPLQFLSSSLLKHWRLLWLCASFGSCHGDPKCRAGLRSDPFLWQIFVVYAYAAPAAHDAYPMLSKRWHPLGTDLHLEHTQWAGGV